jgi:hypothetical protein
MSCSSLKDLGLLGFGIRVVEPPLAFLEEEGNVSYGDAIEAAHVALGLVPEVLDSVDVVLAVGEEPGVVDAKVFEGNRLLHSRSSRINLLARLSSAGLPAERGLKPQYCKQITIAAYPYHELWPSQIPSLHASLRLADYTQDFFRRNLPYGRYFVEVAR